VTGLAAARESFGARRGDIPHDAKNHPIAIARHSPQQKLVLSQSNVRRVKVGISVEELAEDIYRRGGLLQSLNVRPVLDTEGNETGMFEVLAGGRRFQALMLAAQLLVAL
jgi:ParB family chromosome partitioning protein